MSNLFQLQKGSKSFGDKILFDGASFSVNEGEHIGVIGPNGAGKTTLFKVLVGQQDLDSGDITKSNSLRIGYLEQEAEWTLNTTVEEYLSESTIKPIWELKQLGVKLGLKTEHMNSLLSALSGGYRMRVKLLYLIGQEPNLLLLDEPTNFLDLETLIVLEAFLQDFKGAFLLISHDREFLRRVTDHIVEVEGGEITKFAGNLDDYFEQKALLQELLQKQVLSQDAKRKSVMDFVARFGAKATKARQAQSRLKRLEKMEVIDLKKAPSTSQILLPKPITTGKRVLEAKELCCGYSNNPILNKVNLHLDRGDHLGIVGINGAGKSTLLKTLAQELDPLSGSVSYGHLVQVAYYAQHTPEKLNLNDSVLESLQSAAHPSCSQQEILNIAGSLLFSGDAVKKKVSVLSGGEKSRVALGQLLLKKAPLLLLDEPTNHLDFDTVEALTEALSAYEGTIVTVSHDRGFIGRVATKILEIQNGQLTVYPGTYDEYVWSVQRGILSERSCASVASINKVPTEGQRDTPKKSGAVNIRAEKKRLELEIKQALRSIQAKEKQILDLNLNIESLNNELLSAKGESAQNIMRSIHLAIQQKEVLEGELLVLMQTEEDLQKMLSAL